MSTRSDQQAQLERLRPRSVVDTAWPVAARDAALTRIMHEAQVPEEPRRPRRRLLMASALSAVLIPTSVGVAAAQGLISPELVSHLAWWNDQSGGLVDSQNARRVAQGPGPDGTMLTVWSAAGAEGNTCISVAFEAPGALDRPVDVTPTFNLGSCSTAAQQDQSSFGDLGASLDDKGVQTMLAAAGKEAVRAELQFADGAVQDVVAIKDNFAFWYRVPPGTAAPELVGYDSAGQEVDRVQLPDLVTGTH